MPPEKFLRLIFRDSRGYLCLARISRLNGAGFVQYFFKFPEELDRAVEWIEANDLYGMDLYYCPHLLRRPERKKEFALPSYVLWADLDECHPKNLGKYGEPKPQLVLQTSQGRWQAYWMLERPAMPDKVEDFNHRIAEAYRSEGCDPSGWDIGQLLRINTRNWKYVKNE